MQTASAPRLRDLVDYRLFACLASLGLLALIASNGINRKVDAHFVPLPAKAVPADWVPGATVAVGITVVTKDADRLACANDQTFGTAHCEFKQDRQRWPHDESGPAEDNGADLIVPYRTDIGNHLLFVAGLWDGPAMAFRRHREPSRSIPEPKLKRFVAHCELEFVGRFEDIDLRWDYSKPWYTEHNAPVARAKSCFIE